jgi:hypothetical protein
VLHSAVVDHWSERQNADGDSDTGKRGAARTTNSGLPVDHSGPGLRVGPTTPATADLNSAACPPISPFASSRSDISQHKSGRESESGALSGASGASDEVLRSAATQSVSSLDEVQNNRNTYESIFVNTASGRGKSCGRFTIVGIVDGVQRFIRLDCKCWDCKYCGPKKARRYKNAIRDTAEAHKLCRFLTLTLDPCFMDRENPVAYINKAYAKWRIYLKRKLGARVVYIRILEFQKNGNPHFHILVDRFIPHSLIQSTWQAAGGGRMVFIKYVDIHRISRYLSKYLTKELLLSAPKRSRRITVSRGILLFEKRKFSDFQLVRKSIGILFAEILPDLANVELDEEDVLKAFFIEL